MRQSGGFCRRATKHPLGTTTATEKEYAFEHLKKESDKFDAEAYLNRPKPYPTTLAQKMYAYAMPRQFSMLKIAPYVVIPVFKSKELNGGYVSKLNPFSTIWCVIENIFLAATAEGLACSMHIPVNEEHELVKQKLKVPTTYMIPVFIGIGCADPNETILEQNEADLDKQIHFGKKISWYYGKYADISTVMLKQVSSICLTLQRFRNKFGMTMF